MLRSLDRLYLFMQFKIQNLEILAEWDETLLDSLVNDRYITVVFS